MVWKGPFVVMSGQIVAVRRFIYIILFIFFGHPCGQAASPRKWELTWSDEFNYKGSPDTNLWNYEIGFIRNGEPQYYTARTNNTRVENGCLTIEMHREDYLSAHYTSASLTTKDKVRFHYGKYEIRAKLPAGRGVWPAIWMVGAQFQYTSTALPLTAMWPYCGEIDIMENYGEWNVDTIFSTVHYSDTVFGNPENRYAYKKGGNYSVINPDKSFHVYGMEWTKDKMKFMVDDRTFYTFKIDDVEPIEGQNPFNQPFMMILNFAASGTITNNTSLPQKFLIDYVRVYKDRRYEEEEGGYFTSVNATGE